MKPIAKHKFEIPYNNDPSLIDRIANTPVLKDYVKFIYFPCNAAHGIAASPYDRSNQHTIEETVQIMEHIMNAGFEPCVLIQRGEDLDGLSFYFNRGCKYFTIGDDNLARKAREKYGNDIYLTASVTKLIPPEEYHHLDGLYDLYILQYYFNRHIEALKQLPKDQKYGLMPNTVCLWNCALFNNHWFPDIYGYANLNCDGARFKNNMLNFKNTAYILPEDLHYFEDYVESYKLVDRMFRTDHIISAFNAYIYGESDFFANDEEPGEAKYQLS